MKCRLFVVVLSLIVGLGCGSDARGEDPAPPGTDAGAADAGAPPDSGPALDAAPAIDAPAVETDAGPEIPAELLEICQRRGVPEGYELACDVEREHITVPTDGPVPDGMQLFPGVTQFNMNGWEWWQKWPGGHAPTFEYEEATDPAIRCSVASALRFAAIMQDPPADLVTMLGPTTTWEGRFFNWNDDYSQPAAEGDADGAVLWAWEWYLLKWISQTARDGSCYLPTRSMLIEAGATCLATAAAADGVIQGCQAPR